MGIEPFIRQHAPYHKHACVTVYRWYYGRLDLSKILQFSMYVEKQKIVDNIMKENTVFTHLSKRMPKGKDIIEHLNY